MKNTDAALRFDAFIFRSAAIAAIKIKKIRHAFDENAFVEKLFPDEIEALRSLPLPPQVLRELWIRTQNERVWHWFSILPSTMAEIGFNLGLGYVNPHFWEDEWKQSLQHEIARYSIKDGELEKKVLFGRILPK